MPGRNKTRRFKKKRLQKDTVQANGFYAEGELPSIQELLSIENLIPCRRLYLFVTCLRRR